MSLFFDDQAWVTLAEGEARAIVLRLNAKMVSGEDEASRVFVHSPGDHAPSGKHAALPVTAVSRRRLSFYPAGWFVYRLTCAIDAIPRLSAYQHLAFAFAVCGPAATDDTCTPINWKSAPLHGLNKSLELDLSRLDGDQVREYLLFFCTFIGGEGDSSGAIAPFFLPRDPIVFAWDETLDDFGTVCRDLRLQMFAPVVDPNRVDEFDLPEAAPSAPRSSPPDDGSRRPAPENAIQARAIADAFAAHPRTPSPSTAETQRDPTSVDSDAVGAEDLGEAGKPRSAPEWTALFDALVWYGSALFLATFSVQRNGVVQMLVDKPIAGATSLAVPRWEAWRGPANVWLLCRQLKREGVSAAELLQRIAADIEQRSAISPQTAGTRVRLRGLRVNDPLERALVFSGPVRLDDIEFTHDVVLDDSIFERSLELLNCRFLQRLSGRDVTVKGAMRLDGSRIDGAVELGALEAGERQLPALDLRGLVVDRGLFADRLTAFGRMRGEWIRIGSTVRARGLQRPLRNQPPAASSRSSTFGFSRQRSTHSCATSPG